MQFQITIKKNRITYTFIVEHFYITERSERFKIVARNITIILESNRPLFRNKGLKHRKPASKEMPSFSFM